MKLPPMCVTDVAGAKRATGSSSSGTPTSDRDRLRMVTLGRAGRFLKDTAEASSYLADFREGRAVRGACVAHSHVGDHRFGSGKVVMAGVCGYFAGLPEGWPSGLRHTLGKRAYGKTYRGFESRPFRHTICRVPAPAGAADGTIASATAIGDIRLKHRDPKHSI